jgi:DNA polymerase-3 subunit delta
MRAMAEARSGAGGYEVLEGEAATPEAVALALNAMTFAVGWRFVIVEGVQEWKDNDVEAHVKPVLEAMPPETSVGFFGRDDGRKKTPKALVDAVQKAGGAVTEHATIKPKDLPGWAVAEATRLGVVLEGAGAQALVQRVGERQQRLLRELETLALEHGQGARIGVEEVQDAAALSAERQVWGLVDAIVGRNEPAALRAYLDLRDQGEALPRLVPLMAKRIRDVLAIAARIEDGEAPAQIKASMKGNPWAIDRRIKEARSTDPDALRRALETLARLELDSRGLGDLGEDTLGLRALTQMTR